MKELLGGADILNQKDQIDGAHIEQSEDEQNLVRSMLNEFYKWKAHRDQYSKNWLEYYKFMRGSQWDSQRPSWRNSEVVNLVWSAIQSQIPLQTDVRPKFEFLPKEPSDMVFADILDKVSDSD